MNKSLILAGSILCAVFPLTACEDTSPEDEATSGTGGANAAALNTGSTAPGTTTGTGGSSGGQTAPATEVEWAGVFTLDAPAEYWTEPPLIGSEIGGFVPRFLIALNGTTVTLGTARDGVQDLCTPTVDVPAVMAKPSFTLGPVDYQMHLVGQGNDARVNATIRNLTMTDVLPPAESGTITAVLDAREIYPLFHVLLDPSPEAVCAALASFDPDEPVACAACPQDQQPFCLTIKATFVTAQAAPDTVLAPVDGAMLGAECADYNPKATTE